MKKKPTYQELEKELKAFRVTINLIEKSPIVRVLWKNQKNWPVEDITENVKNILAYTANDFLSGKIVYSEIIHPDDLQRVTEEVNENSKTDCASFEHKPYRIVCKTGKIKWLKDITLIRRDETGKITHYDGIIIDITEQKEAEINIKKLSTAVEQSANTIVITDTDANIEYINPQFTVLTGYTAEEVLGQNPRILNAGILPKEYYIEMWQILTAGKIWKGEFCNKTKQDELYWEQVTITPIKDENKKIINYLAIKEDITARKKADTALKESEEKTNTLLNSTNDLVFLLNPDGIIITCNENFAKSMKINKEKLIGTYFYQHLSKESAESRKLIFQKTLEQKKPLVSEDEINNEHFINSLYPIFDNKGNIKRVAVFSSNITKRKKAELELKKQNNEYVALNEEYKTQNEKLVIAKEKAEEGDRLKTEFINNMSHEIRTPLNGILGFSSILNNPKLTDEKRRQYVNIIKNSGNQLMRIIDDVLEISKLVTNQVKITEKQICLNDLLLEQFLIFDIKAKENKTPLYIKKELSDKESTIITDSSKLSKIISNLLENAIRFTNTGFVEFGYTIVETKHTLSLQLYVKDTGIGIQPENQKAIFERFLQEEKKLSRNVSGLGLGLSIAKENAELLGGKITLKSEKGKGSTFFVTIPYKPVISKTGKSNSDNNKGKKTKKQEQYTVLIVEDEEVNYLYINTLFEDFELNLKTIHAKHGKEAVEICKEISNIDFIIMDLKLPIMDGFEATKQIKKFRPELPIVAQTAYSTKEDKQKAISAGCDDFISKPISKEIFNEVINKYLQIFNRT